MDDTCPVDTADTVEDFIEYFAWVIPDGSG